MCYNCCGDVMKEKSCGAIIFKEENDELKFLLVHQHNGHFSFPKGHMEKNETEIETALREIKEETNLDAKLDTNFRVLISYFMESKNTVKEAVYFIGTPLSNVLKSQEGEILNCDWYSYDEVMEKLEFDNIKDVFIKAHKYIKNI